MYTHPRPLHTWHYGRDRRRLQRPIVRWSFVLTLAVTLSPWLTAGPVSGVRAADAPAAMFEGVVAEPEGLGVRVRVLLAGTFNYTVTAHRDRILISLDGVTAEAASYHLPIGPVTVIGVHPASDHRPHVDVAITTRTPLDVVESFLQERALVIRLAPVSGASRGTTRPHPSTSMQSGDGRTSPPPQASEERASLRGSRAAIPRVIRLTVGTGRVIPVDELVRVAVSDPRVLGAVPVSNRELLITGRTAGRTTMYVWEGAGHLLAFAVEVLPATDRIAGLRGLLGSLFPDAAITVTEVPDGPGGLASEDTARRDVGTVSTTAVPTVGGRLSSPRSAAPVDAPLAGVSPSPPVPEPHTDAGARSPIVLSGAVETQFDRQKAEDVARAFAPTIVNLLSVRRPIQLKLQVEVVELSRSALRSLGVTWGEGQQIPGASPSLNGGVYNLQLITAPGVGASGLDLLIAQIQTLTQQGHARLLAEPSLIVLAGRTASLLLGGQVPVPVAGPNGSVTIEYRDFGIILNAHPDYQEDGRVFMQVAPEVSTLDFANAIKVSGFTIPALRVRRAQTVVSMLPTQTLVLGGMLQQQEAELAQKIPVLGDLPIIGPLFQSKAFQRQETDLVIFVTPVLIEPGGGAAPPTTP